MEGWRKTLNDWTFRYEKLLKQIKELEAERDHYKKYAADIETRLADAVETLKDSYHGHYVGQASCHMCDCLARISGGGK